MEDVTIKAENDQTGLSGTFYLGDVIDLVSTELFDIGQFIGGLTQYFSPDEPFKLDWSYSTEGSAYRDIGVSEHTVYVTLEEKYASLNKVYLSYLHWATSNPGATTKSEVIQKTWQHFASKNLTAWDGERKLYYYKIGAVSPSELPVVESSLIRANGYSECTDFAELLIESLQVNNITGIQEISITPIQDDRMLIKKWEPIPHEPTIPDNMMGYQWKFFQYNRLNGSLVSSDGTTATNGEYGDLSNKPDIPGQNTLTPAEKVFGNHVI